MKVAPIVGINVILVRRRRLDTAMGNPVGDNGRRIREGHVADFSAKLAHGRNRIVHRLHHPGVGSVPVP
jgi:hypothetical protein